MTGCDAFQIYMALKLHFTSKSYDFFKFNGKTKANNKSFMNRKDRHFFEKLGSTYNKDVKDFLLSNFVEKSDLWIGELFDNVAEDNFTNWKKRVESMRYNFGEEVSQILNFIEKDDLNFDDIFIMQDGRHPLIMRLLLQKEISIESFIVMDNILGFMKQFDKDMHGDFIWEELGNKCRNYSPFIKFDVSQYKTILVKKMKEREMFS